MPLGGRGDNMTHFKHVIVGKIDQSRTAESLFTAHTSFYTNLYLYYDFFFLIFLKLAKKVFFCTRKGGSNIYLHKKSKIMHLNYIFEL